MSERKKNNLPEIRRPKLKNMLQERNFIRVLEASNGLTGLIVERTNIKDKETNTTKEFDCMWVSSLCDSTLKGKPDIELVDFTSRMHTIHEIIEVTTKPILFDGDTGGRLEHFTDHVTTLESLGVSGIVIEDKKGLKKNSLFGTKVKQELDSIEHFQEKIRAGKKAQVTSDFMIFARLESFIAGLGMEDAMERARAYRQAGADGIMIHSKEQDGKEILDFLQEFRREDPKTPIIVVPTTYNHYTEEELKKEGANILIYANHLLRSAYLAMQNTAMAILEDGNSKRASEQYCMPIQDLIDLIPGGR